MYQSSQTLRNDDCSQDVAETEAALNGGDLLTHLYDFFKSSDEIAASDSADQLIRAVRRIIELPSCSSLDLRRKIFIWRKLVDESIFDPAAQSLDEGLLISILGDVERLLEDDQSGVRA